MLARVAVALAAVAATALAVRLALADDEQAPAAAASGPAPAAEPVPDTAPGEGEAEEPGNAPPPPSPRPAQSVRVPTLLKDGMLRIPGGRFTMGSSDRTAPPNERPARAAVVPSFWIDRTEVTVSAYRTCVERGACPRPARTSAACTYDMGEPELPVSCVPWSSAQAYCAAVGKRLPRELEWELAARGPLGLRYPWGSGFGCGAAVTLVRDGSQRSCGGKRPAKVGSRPAGASPYGVLDMSGNVEEWVADWYAETASELSPLSGASHVLRGGGWLSAPSQSRATSRGWGSVLEAGPNVGFRCARDDARG